MITHYHTQAMRDACKGANTFSIKEPILFSELSYERLFGSACCINGICSLNLLTFSDN